jgi:hypothetical protein
MIRGSFRFWRSGVLLTAMVISCGSPPRSQDAVSATDKKAADAVREDAGKSGVAVGWQVLDEADLSRHGKVYVDDGRVILEEGSPMTGIRWTGPVLREEYEVALEAMRVDGNDFFCGMTFPVGDSPCTLILGGWGGTLVGLSNVDGSHAAENETTTSVRFENGRWYRVKLRVTKEKIESWVDAEKVIDLVRGTHKFTVWLEQEPVRPLGFATWYTKAALRNIALRNLADNRETALGTSIVGAAK